MCTVLHQHHHHGESGGGSLSLLEDEENDEKKWWHKFIPQQSNYKEKKDKSRKRKGKNSRNINVRAAFIHVIGDLIQSIGILIAGYIIKFFVSYVSIFN